MSTFVILLIAIGVFFIGKFIYDSYLTDNTERNWDKYKQSNPESAARVDRNRGFNLSTKPKTKEEDRRDSLLRMASNQGCSPSEVQQTYIEGLKQQNLDASMIQVAIEMCRKKKYEESQIFNIDPDDTISAFMETWTIEFLENKGYADRQRTRSEVNDDLIDSRVNEMHNEDEPSEKYRIRAINKMYIDHDYTEAIELINQGLEINEISTRPFLLRERAECQFMLMNYKLAIKDMNRAITALLNNFPDRYDKMGDFLASRANMKDEIGDKDGASEDSENAFKFFKKSEMNNQDDQDQFGQQELPF